MSDLDDKTAAAMARLDARPDPIAPAPPPADAALPAQVLTDLRLLISLVRSPDGADLEFATLGPDGAVPIAHALPVLLRDSANAILHLAQNGAAWPRAVFHAAKTVANAFVALEQEVSRMQAAKAAADLRAKDVF